MGELYYVKWIEMNYINVYLESFEGSNSIFKNVVNMTESVVNSSFVTIWTCCSAKNGVADSIWDVDMVNASE